MEAILSLGSNLGDRRIYLTVACAALAHLPQTRLTAVSRIYATEPVVPPGAPPQPEFYNAIVILETALAPHALLAATQGIEKRLGRTRGSKRHAARVIDLDLICLGNLVLDEPDLQLPHPRAAARRFVCAPLAELRPDLVLPGQAGTVRDLLIALPATPGVRLAKEQWPHA